MNKQNLLTIIASVLFLFAIGKIAMQQLCEPTPNNIVANVVSSAMSPATPLQASPQLNPFSWDPILQKLVGYLSKACVR
jgi:hypothetical protein